MIKMNFRWGNQASATDPFLEAPGSVVAAVFLMAYLVAWWPFMAVCMGVYILTAAATSLLVLLSLPCVLFQRIRPKHLPRHRPGRGPRATPAP
jgi:dolichyl-phosphate-mannose--protein O-mannosyl transferase